MPPKVSNLGPCSPSSTATGAPRRDGAGSTGLASFCDPPHAPDSQRREILDGPHQQGSFVRSTEDGESRERLREAFNTPLYPMVLLANEVMQEGLRPHRNCRRIVHHDLAWNPTRLERRVRCASTVSDRSR